MATGDNFKSRESRAHPHQHDLLEAGHKEPTMGLSVHILETHTLSSLRTSGTHVTVGCTQAQGTKIWSPTFGMW